MHTCKNDNFRTGRLITQYTRTHTHFVQLLACLSIHGLLDGSVNILFCVCSKLSAPQFVNSLYVFMFFFFYFLFLLLHLIVYMACVYDRAVVIHITTVYRIWYYPPTDGPNCLACMQEEIINSLIHLISYSEYL